MKNIKEDITHPTLSKPVGDLGKGYEANFRKTMNQGGINLNETDGLLTEREQSLKKKIFSLAKMEALVFADPKLSTVYDEMSENGEEKYGYHYNETIMNMLFNDYVLNSPKYLQKYKMSIPAKKKRRDKSGINQLKKAGDVTMHKKPVNPIQTTPAVAETTGAASSGAFAGPAAWQKGGDLMETEKVEETTTSSSSGAYVGPASWGGGDLMKGGKSKAMRKPIWKGGTIIQESNYLTDPSAFAKYIDMLNEDMDLSYQQKLGDEYQKSHSGSNKGLGVSEVPVSSEIEKLKSGIDNNTSLYVGQDVDRMRPDDVKILHNDMTKSNTLFPSKNNPNLPDDGIAGRQNEQSDASYIAQNSQAYGTVNNMNPENQALIKKDMTTGKWDTPQLSPMEEEVDNDLLDFDIPEWAMSALINGDDSGLEDEDIAKLNQFEQKVVAKYGNANFMLGDIEGKDNLGFRPSNDIDNLGSDVYRLYLKPTKASNPVDYETSAADRMYNSDAWVQAQRDAEGLDEEGGEWEAKQDLMQLQRDGAESVLNANKYIPILKKLVSTSKSKDDLLRIVGQYLREKGITDSDLYQSVIDKAIEISKGLDEGNDFATISKQIGNTPDGADFREQDGQMHLYFDGNNSNASKWAQDASKKHGIPAHDTQKIGVHETMQSIMDDKMYETINKTNAMIRNNESLNPSDINQYIETLPKIKKYGNAIRPTDILITNDNLFFDVLAVDGENVKITDGFKVNQTIKINKGLKYTVIPDATGNIFQKLVNMSSKVEPESDEMDGMYETMQSIIDDKPDSVAKGIPTGTVSTGNVPVGLVDMKEDVNLLNEINNELNAYSIHHKKLKQMSEDRKPSSLVLKDRLGAENATNFKKDFNNSDTKEIIDVQKELEWQDQQTDVGADPQKLGQDLEKNELKTTKGEAFKNVGNSTNDKGDEVPKRNMTTAEQDEVNIYRKGMHSLNYDNKPDERFEDRMKADMGDAVYEIREKQMAEFGKAPMYNKEAQPIQQTKAVRTEFDKEKSGWNDLKGLSESMISGRYRNALNKSKIIDFQLNEVKFLKQTSEKTMEALFPLDFTGLGNTLNGKTTDYKVSVNEGVVTVLDENKFFTDGKQIFAIKNPKQNLSEGDIKAKPVVNEEMNKMKHLFGYKGTDFVSTTNVKKNRGF